MKIRKPNFDFSQTPAHWSKTPEFAQTSNASSIWIPHLERFLNRVMAKAAGALSVDDPAHVKLKAHIKTFIRQEAHHHATHEAFNRVLYRAGYDVSHFEKMFEEEYKKLFETKSLAFLCAYCEGFETLGPPAAIMWLDDNVGEEVDQGDPNAVGLWKWHLMEEFEHRTVCFDVYNTVHGGYFLRVYAFFYQLTLHRKFSKMVLDYLMEHDWSKMTAEDIAESKKRLKGVARRQAGLMLPRLFKVLLPFYSPYVAKEPQNFERYRAQFDNEFQTS